MLLVIHCTIPASLENPGIHIQNLSVVSHLFALGRWRVKPVVGEIASEDVQFTGNYPPGIPKIQIVLGREKGFELPGKQDTHRGCWGRPVPEPRQSHVRNLGTKDAVRAHSGVSQCDVMDAGRLWKMGENVSHPKFFLSHQTLLSAFKNVRNRAEGNTPCNTSAAALS